MIVFNQNYSNGFVVSQGLLDNPSDDSFALYFAYNQKYTSIRALGLGV